jgi:acyl-CoA thioester hydrolase
MKMADRFAVRIVARGYEVDSNGHVAGTVLMQYGQQARWECLRAAGIDQRGLQEIGIGPVSLEERIRFHHEVRAGEELDVSCNFVWGDGRTFRVEHELRKSDGTLAAEATSVGGLLDLEDRRLIAEPGAVWRSAANAPAVLGL